MQRWIVSAVLALLLAVLGFATWIYVDSEAHLRSCEDY
jgi:hypothetical protein